MKRIINLTPHEVVFVNEEGVETMKVPSSGICRLSTRTVQVGEINGIPITTTQFGEIEGLPEETEDVIYIVSSLVAGRCKDRSDVFIPNESVRDSAGRIIGCRSLGRI